MTFHGGGIYGMAPKKMKAIPTKKECCKPMKEKCCKTIKKKIAVKKIAKDANESFDDEEMNDYLPRKKKAMKRKQMAIRKNSASSSSDSEDIDNCKPMKKKIAVKKIAKDANESFDNEEIVKFKPTTKSAVKKMAEDDNKRFDNEEIVKCRPMEKNEKEVKRESMNKSIKQQKQITIEESIPSSSESEDNEEFKAVKTKSGNKRKPKKSIKCKSKCKKLAKKQKKSSSNNFEDECMAEENEALDEKDEGFDTLTMRCANFATVDRYSKKSSIKSRMKKSKSSSSESDDEPKFLNKHSIKSKNNYSPPPPPKAERIEKSVIGIVSAMHFDGRWKSELLKQLLEFTGGKGRIMLNQFFDSLKLNEDDENKEDVKSTVAALCVLHSSFSNENSKWKIAKMKAIRWLNSKLQINWQTEIQNLVASF